MLVVRDVRKEGMRSRVSAGIKEGGRVGEGEFRKQN